MDKHILHSVLETLTIGGNISVAFNEPFTELSGDYIVLQSKTGRGRGGSRVIELQSVLDAEDTFGALDVGGKERLLGTGTSEYISTLTVDGKVHGLEDPFENTTKAPKVKRAPDAPRQTKREGKATAKVAASASVGRKVAGALGSVLANNANSSFKLTGRQPGSPITGEWRVVSFTHENEVLCMECVDISNAERTLSFDSSVHGVNVKDAEVMFTS